MKKSFGVHANGNVVITYTQDNGEHIDTLVLDQDDLAKIMEAAALGEAAKVYAASQAAQTRN